jgi:hypothetical protein
VGNLKPWEAGLPETLSSSAPAKEVLILGVNELMVASSVSIFFFKKKNHTCFKTNSNF